MSGPIYKYIDLYFGVPLHGRTDPLSFLEDLMRSNVALTVRCLQG